MFMPVQALNKMRREVLEASGRDPFGYRRNSSVPPKGRRRERPKRLIWKKDRNLLSLSRRKQQFEMVLGKFKMYRKVRKDHAESIFAAESFDAQEWKKPDRCHEAGVRCYLRCRGSSGKEAEQYFKSRWSF